MGYKHTNTTVSMLNYHIVFCPRYRRKIFNIEGVEARFKELTTAACKANNIEILAMECQVDHVHMAITVTPKNGSIPHIIQIIKGATSFALREEFPQLAKMPSLWTSSYFIATTGEVSTETIKQYINSQKTHYA